MKAANYKTINFLLYLTFLGNLADNGTNINNLVLHLRRYVRDPFLKDGWKDIVSINKIAPDKTALIICDMWDVYRGEDQSTRSHFLAKKINSVVNIARKRGIKIIHAPCETMNFYKKWKQHESLLKIPSISLPVIKSKENTIPEPPLKNYNKCLEKYYMCDRYPLITCDHSFSSQNKLISITDEDLISDNMQNVYNFLQHKKIEKVFIVGQHFNRCVFNRPIGIKMMVNYGINLVVIRDLVVIWPDYKLSPYLGYDEQYQLFLKWIEKYWCPTIDSIDLVEI